jgi:SAM-dependent methyltransferase
MITGATVRADFNDPNVVIHYARAAERLGLWASERLMIERWLPARDAPLLEAGCGAGRVALGLWELGYRRLTGVDFAAELIDQARGLAAQRGAAIEYRVADVTRLGPVRRAAPGGFAGALFLFNGLMQIPGRASRRRALRELRAACRPGALLLFTTHDREDDPREQPHWAAETERWALGEQDPCLAEFGDRHFRDSHGGHTFMHLPTRREVREDLAAAGWEHRFDAMRRELAVESAAVREFSDECRFWVGRRPGAGDA